MFFQKNYKTTLFEELLSTLTGEIEVKLNLEPVSSTGYLLFEPGTPNEESAYYHRKVGTSVFIYGVNRDNPVLHLIGTPVILTNAIDALNYLGTFVNESGYIYKKSSSQIIVTGGKYSIDKVLITISDLDTSLGLINKVLIPNVLNYIYIKNNDYYITSIQDQTLYQVGLVSVNGAGIITNITKEKIQDLGFSNFIKGEVPSGTINGINLNFSLANTPLNEVILFLNGIRQKKTLDYIISSNIITFVTAPIAGDVIIVDYNF